MSTIVSFSAEGDVSFVRREFAKAILLAVALDDADDIEVVAALTVRRKAIPLPERFEIEVPIVFEESEEPTRREGTKSTPPEVA